MLTLTAAGSGIVDTLGNALATDAGETWAVDATAPTATITAVTPDPRSTTVGSVTITFNEAISGFDLGDLTLTRNGTSLLPGAATLTTADNITWTLGSLAGLTDADGNYVLTVVAAGVGHCRSGRQFTLGQRQRRVGNGP